MRASYPAKSQKLRPGSGLPQNQKPKSKPKRPPPAATCFLVGAALSRRMGASYPAKSQTLRPGVGPPTESKAQKQTKAPTTRSDLLFFCGSRAPAANAGFLPSQEPKASPRGPGSGLPQNQKLKSKPKRPSPAATCFFCGRRALAASAGDSPPTETTTQSAQPAAADR